MANSRKRRITQRDWNLIAEYISDEVARRAGKRRELDRQWKEIDRQVRMEYRPAVDEKGRPLENTDWFPQIELPLQAQTLELLNADARRMMFSTDRNWFSARVGLTDDYLQKNDFKSFILGDDNDVPSTVDQVSADALVEGALSHLHSMYDLRAAWDNLNAEAFKYGTFAGRVRMVKRSHDFLGPRGPFKSNARIPILVPQSIKATYLDDTMAATMREGHVYAPAHIFSYWQELEDLKRAAMKGSRDPENGGGWMPERLKDIESPVKNRSTVQVLEYEGDLILPRTDGPPLYLQNCIVSVVVGKKNPTVFRFRWLEFDFNDYLVGHYHRDDLTSPYGVSPLMKGRPVQAIAVEAYSRLAQASALNTQPPIKWNPQDNFLQAMGGPEIAPNAKWAALGDVEPQQIGDPGSMLLVFQAALQMYADVTGISAPRLGAQTKSHQTAFAVDTEQSRGVVRTVDYVRAQAYGAMTTFLHMETRMLRDTMEKQPVFIPKWHGWAEFGKDAIPESVTYDVHGAGGPAEEAERAAKMGAALQQVLQIEVARRQVGEQGVDLQEMQETILREGGFIDIERFFAAASGNEAAAGPGGPGVPGTPGLVESPEQALIAQLAG